MTLLEVFLIILIIAAFICGVLFARRNQRKVEAGVAKGKELADEGITRAQEVIHDLKDSIGK